VIIEPTAIPDVLLIKPKIFGDVRGYFYESFQKKRYKEAGIDVDFVQDNLSKSAQGVLRGLHVQHPHSQSKLVSVVKGEVFDVAVDIRYGSKTFGKWVGEHLSETNKHQLYIPKGFAHGFLVLSDDAIFSYKCDDTYHPETELSVRWNDPDISISWPLSAEIKVSLSNKDAEAPLLKDITVDRLPRF
jgi:dTDP-4-dehydrorhamnose 3,5-epimerase